MRSLRPAETQGKYPSAKVQPSISNWPTETARVGRTPPVRLRSLAIDGTYESG